MRVIFVVLLTLCCGLDVAAQTYDKLRVESFRSDIKVDWSFTDANACRGDHHMVLSTDAFDLRPTKDPEHPGEHFVGVATIKNVSFVPATYVCGECTNNGIKPHVDEGKMVVWATVLDDGSLDVLMCPGIDLATDEADTKHSWSWVWSGADGKCPTAEQVVDPVGIWQDAFYGGHGRNGSRGDYAGTLAHVATSSQANGSTQWSAELISVRSPFVSISAGRTTISISGVPRGIAVKSVASDLEQYFLRGVSVQNEHRMRIDWAGSDEADRKAWFLLNGVRTDAAVSGDEATHTFDVGTEYPVGAVTVTAGASAGTKQARVDAEPLLRSVVEVPEWAAPASSITATTSGNEVQYKREFRWPDPELQAYVSIPDIVPYVGGRWGLLPTGLEFDVNASSLGTHMDGAFRGNAGVAFGKDHDYELSIKGTTSGWLTSTALEAEANVRLQLPMSLYRDERRLLDLLNLQVVTPDLPLLGEAIGVLNDILGVGVTSEVRANFDVDARFRASGSSFEWVDGSGTATISGQIRASADLYIASLLISGGGSASLTIAVPTWKATATGTLSYEASAVLFDQFSFYGSGQYTISSGRTDQTTPPSALITTVDDPSGDVLDSASIAARTAICTHNGVIYTTAGGSVLYRREGSIQRSVKLFDQPYVTSPSITIDPRTGTIAVAVIVSDQRPPDLTASSGAITEFMRSLYVQVRTVTSELAPVATNSVRIDGRACVQVRLVSPSAAAPALVVYSTDGTTLLGSTSAPARIDVYRSIESTDVVSTVANLTDVTSWDVAVAKGNDVVLAYCASGDVFVQQDVLSGTRAPYALTTSTEREVGVRFITSASSPSAALCWLKGGEVWGTHDLSVAPYRMMQDDGTIGLGFLQAQAVVTDQGPMLMWPSGNDIVVTRSTSVPWSFAPTTRLAWNSIDMRPALALLSPSVLAITSIAVPESTSQQWESHRGAMVVHTVSLGSLTHVQSAEYVHDTNVLLIERGVATNIEIAGADAITLSTLMGDLCGDVKSSRIDDTHVSVTLNTHVSPGMYVISNGHDARVVLVQ